MNNLNWRGRLINGLSQYRAYYDKGISVLAVIRNMEITDLGILMAVAKYLFGDHIPTVWIIAFGVGYWIFNITVNLAVGWFWEANNGWKIEAQVFGKRASPGRTVLVDTDGQPYGSKQIAEDLSETLLRRIDDGQ